MKTIHVLSIITLALAGTLSLQAKPTISHTPVNSSAPGQPITILAKVQSEGRPVKSVYLHFTQSREVAPNRVKMNPTGVGGYFGTISPQFTRGSKELHYYIEAQSTDGEMRESPWHTIRLAGGGAVIQRAPDRPAPVQPAAAQPNPPPRQPYRLAALPPLHQPIPRPPQEEGLTSKKWFWPAVIGGGAVAVIGVVALSDSGGGGGGGGGGGSSNSGDNSVQVSGADNRSAQTLTLPIGQTLDASTEVGNRTVTGVRVNLNYNPADNGPETFVVTYAGSPVINTGATTLIGSAVGEAAGSAKSVTVEVTTSQVDPVTGGYNFNWTATATFFLE